MRTTIGTAIRLAESVLLSGGRKQARLNAWTSVCENRRHAADRAAAHAIGTVRPGRRSSAHGCPGGA